MTIETFTRVDNTVCWRCGAVAGRCEHIKRDDYEFSVSFTTRDFKQRWTPTEISALQELLTTTLTYREIAKELGRSPQSVAEKAYQLGWRTTNTGQWTRRHNGY